MATVITLKPGKEPRLAGGHLWIYAGEIRTLDGTVEGGAVVDVRAADRSYIGHGYFNPRSRIAVRLLTRRREPIDEGFFRRRLEAALALRRRVVSSTDACRLVYSEGDGLPGLIVDRYGEMLVVHALARAGPATTWSPGPTGVRQEQGGAPRAAAGDKEINLQALKVLRPGGILVSCSSSAHVSEELLLAIVVEARLLEASTQARDHPIQPGMPRLGM